MINKTEKKIKVNQERTNINGLKSKTKRKGIRNELTLSYLKFPKTGEISSVVRTSTLHVEGSGSIPLFCI